MNGTFTSYAAVLMMPAGQAAHQSQQRTTRRIIGWPSPGRRGWPSPGRRLVFRRAGQGQPAIMLVTWHLVLLGSRPDRALCGIVRVDATAGNGTLA